MNNTLKHTAVKPDKLTFVKYKDFLLTKYETQQLLIQTPWLNINAFGMPKRDKYHATDDQLRYIKLPIDTNKEDNKQFLDLLQQLDNKLNTEEFKKEYLGEKHKKYEYHPIVAEKENKPASVKQQHEMMMKTSAQSYTKQKTNNERKLKMPQLTTLSNTFLLEVMSDASFKLLKCGLNQQH